MLLDKLKDIVYNESIPTYAKMTFSQPGWDSHMASSMRYNHAAR